MTILNSASVRHEGASTCKGGRIFQGKYYNDYTLTLTQDDFEEGGGHLYNMLFLESPKIGEVPPPVKKEKKLYNGRKNPPTHIRIFGE
jgi:hypothetical protein